MRRIVIIGGGIMGSAIAYSLARAGAVAEVTVVEPDPTYDRLDRHGAEHDSLGWLLGARAAARAGGRPRGEGDDRRWRLPFHRPVPLFLAQDGGG
ncbi:FAD-dependent oxidoreductase [Roseomonas terrae]|uniref:FAD-dependent oxidoreductase n=1 Tax=Neoroseomonas terrae TaxID=424799 RepID=A0ABS5EB63_9PROT|nr:FAD-dependent oxidoreductase [Neoroseomonas terrae]